jgi:HlyD family secretion protein
MKRRKTLRRIVWLAVIGVVIAAIAWALRPRPMAVETVAVTRGALTATVGSEGRTRVANLYVIAAPVDGQLQRIGVQAGDAVSADAVVAQIQPVAPRPLDARSRAEARASVDAARASLARAQATEREARVAVEHADNELARSTKLLEKGAIAAAEAEHAGHESQIRHRALEAARAAVGEARAALARASAVVTLATTPGDAPVQVTSPIAGQILRVLRESAGPVAAGTPLVEVGEVTRLEIRADLLSNDAASIRAGAAATITGWRGRRALAAKVRRVEPAAFTKISALGLEEQRVHVVLDLVDPLPAGLGHDYRVDVSIETWSGKDALRVPSTALFRAGERWAVFVVRDGRARAMIVDPGETDGTHTVIARGVAEGDVVIAQPTDAIEDRTRVRST